MSNTIATSTSALATGYSPSQLAAISSVGDALVIWFDGTNVQWSYASAPYSSWTTTTLLSSIGGGPRWQAGLYQYSSGDALLVAGNASGNIVSYYFTYNSSGNSWSVGSAVSVETGASDYNGGSVAMDSDAQGRIWVAWSNNGHVIQVYYTPDNGASWTGSTTFTQVSGGADATIGLAYCGDYIVCVYCAATVAYRYQRIDAHAASLGSWSTIANVTNSILDNTVKGIAFRSTPGSNYGVFVGDVYSALPAQYYDASVDTWSAVTNIGASTNDTMPTLVDNGTDIYCLWSLYSSANNYSLVYKQWTTATQTWDGASTQLEANGTNIVYSNGGYGNAMLGFVYTVGTATPWNVNFDSMSFAPAPVLVSRSGGYGGVFT